MARFLAFLAICILLSTVALHSQSPYVFNQAQFPTGTVPESIAVGDFNGDGRLDFAVGNTGGNSISILLGQADGSFAARVDYPTGSLRPYIVITADFNNDGKLDLAFADTYSNAVSILLGNGDGTFQNHIDTPAGQGPRSIVARDFNNDGKMDLAVANQTDNTVSIRRRLRSDF